jgi:hypothetical protein
MSTPNPQSRHPTAASVQAFVCKVPFRVSTRTIMRIVALCLLMALAGSVGYLLHPNPALPAAPSQAPAFVPIPPQASLVRTETFLQDHVQNWYYAVPHLSEAAVQAFYQTHFPQQGWTCPTAMTNTNMSYYGQPLAGTSIYLTALRGTTKVQMYIGDQSYGAWLLQDDLPDDAIALKVSLEPAAHASCS